MKQAVLSRTIYVYTWVGMWIVVSTMYFLSSLHITVSGNTEFLVTSIVFLFALATPLAIACTGHLKFIMTLPNGTKLFLYNLGAMALNTIALITFMHSKELTDIDSHGTTFYLMLTATILVLSHLLSMKPVYTAIEKAISRPLTVPYYIFLASYMMLPTVSENADLLIIFFLLQFIGHILLYERYKETYNNLGSTQTT